MQVISWGGRCFCLYSLLSAERCRAVTLCFRSEERCVFNRETKREVESAGYVRDYGVGTITDKVVTTITEFFWDFSVSWTLLVYVGNEPTDQIVLQKRDGAYEIMTTSKNAPRPEVRVLDPVEVNLTWLLKHINADNQWDFRINRDAKSCRTPRNNEEVDEVNE